jgi:hypothetical protein
MALVFTALAERADKFKAAAQADARRRYELDHGAAVTALSADGPGAEPDGRQGTAE